MERRNFIQAASAAVAGLVGAKTIPERLAAGETLNVSLPLDLATMTPQVSEQSLSEALGCKVTDVKLGTAANGMPEERLTLEFMVEKPNVTELKTINGVSPPIKGDVIFDRNDTPTPITALQDRDYPYAAKPVSTYDVETVEIPEYGLGFFYDRYTGELMGQRGADAKLGKDAEKAIGNTPQMWKWLRPKLTAIGMSRITADEIERRAKDMLVMRGVRGLKTCPDERFTADGLREEIELFRMRYGARPTHLEITYENLKQLMHWMDAPYEDLLDTPRSKLCVYGLKVTIVPRLSPSLYPYLLTIRQEGMCVADPKAIARADFR